MIRLKEKYGYPKSDKYFLYILNNNILIMEKRNLKRTNKEFKEVFQEMDLINPFNNRLLGWLEYIDRIPDDSRLKGALEGKSK